MKKIAVAVFWLLLVRHNGFTQSQELNVTPKGLNAGQSNEVSIVFQNPSLLSRMDVQLSLGLISITNIYREQSGTWIPFWITVDSLKFRTGTESNLVLIRAAKDVSAVYFQGNIPQNSRFKIEAMVSIPYSATILDHVSDYIDLSLYLYTGNNREQEMRTRLTVKNNLK